MLKQVEIVTYFTFVVRFKAKVGILKLFNKIDKVRGNIVYPMNKILFRLSLFKSQITISNTINIIMLSGNCQHFIAITIKLAGLFLIIDK